VTLDSAPGAGTTVSLYLPRATAAPQLHAAAPVPEPLAAAQPVRVLLVDDDEGVRGSACAMLEDMGHTVVAADGGVRALDVLRTDRRFDVLLLDFAMPGMTGAQLASEIVPTWPDAPIVFVTGYVETELLQPWLQRGYTTVRKPFSSADLAAAIRRVTGGRAPADNVVALRK
jgi:CheY-like chemotaxis protein